MGQIGRYNNGSENICFKHLLREREEIKYLQIIIKTQRLWEKIFFCKLESNSFQMMG